MASGVGDAYVAPGNAQGGGRLEGHQSTYALMFEQGVASGMPVADAAIAVAEAYLDDRPARRGKRQIRAADRNAAFWTSQFLGTLPAEVFEAEPLVLALARYMRQEQTGNFDLLRNIAQKAPESVRRAVRYSGLVLRQYSERWKEIEQLAARNPAEFSDFLRVCHTLEGTRREHVEILEVLRKQVADLSPLELLVYASLFAFENLVPAVFEQSSKEIDASADAQWVWDGINDILAWKLQASTDDAFDLTDAAVSRSVREHLSPFLFPSPDLPAAREDLYRVFGRLVAAQVELNRFLSGSIEAFCYDDSICFEVAGTELAIVERDPAVRGAWKPNGERLSRLHVYWLYRAFDEFVASGMATKQMGRPENHERNQFAYIKAIRTKLQLSEVYGLTDSVLTDTGLRVDLFQALLSLELMTAFFINDFLFPYREHLHQTGHWRRALADLALGGLRQPHRPNAFHNRFPITWSDRAAKIENIRPWTVSKAFPHGHAEAAEAILDFWTNDLRGLSARLRGGGPVLRPDLYERPVLKMGRYLFQLPWMVAMQNNASAAINNLRRIGARRTQVGEETRRIEQFLAERLEERGFRVCVNYQPARTTEDDPGEVDLICARDGQVVVLEIKSTFVRRSMKDAWLHKTTTLRKAGLQLRRKVEAVQAALQADEGMAVALGLEAGVAIPPIRGWIVDTSIEHDHEVFSGFMKVSLEEVLIALRDDRHLLSDPEGFFSIGHVELGARAHSERPLPATLYPNGFSVDCFMDAITRQAVWESEAKIQELIPLPPA